MQTRMTRFWDSVGKATVLGLLLSCLIPEKGLAQGPPPIITVQPSDCAAIYGGTAAFTVTAASGTTLTYQWYKDGLLNLDSKLAGATSSTLTINGVGLLDEGTYYVEVRNAGGTITSRHASLSAVLVNSPPVANNDSYTTEEDTPLITSAPGILTNDTDANGNPLTALLVSTVAHGSLMLDPDGGFIYTPHTDYNGSDSFTYAAHDGVVTGNVATVSINVMAVNDPPRANDDSINTDEDVNVSIKVLDNDSDPEGTRPTITSTSTTNATVVIIGNETRILFRPVPDFNGTVIFSYTISDGTNSATANVTVTVTPVNDAPAANDDTYTSPEDEILIVPAIGVLSDETPGSGILANDTDAEGDELTAVIVSNATHGTVSLNSDGSFSYTPTADYNGPDTFTYSAADGSTTGNVATVTINVTPVSDPLRFAAQQMTANGFELKVAGDASAYVISASSNLQDWTPIFTNAAPSGTSTYLDTAAHNYPSRFYRVDAQ